MTSTDAKRIKRNGHHRTSVRDAGRDPSDSRTLEAVFTLRRSPSIYPDAALDAALHHLSRERLLPVVSRADATRLLGTLTLDNVLGVYGFDAPGAVESRDAGREERGVDGTGAPS